MNYNPKKYWTDRGKNYSVSADTSAELKNLGELVLQYGQMGDLIMEIGSGYGRLFDYLLMNEFIRDKAYLMCDISETMIKECKERTGIAPTLWDGKKIMHYDNTFDMVFSFSVMLHVPLSEIFDHFKETIRIAKKYVYIATYHGPATGLAPHCFRHDYDFLIDLFKLKIVDKKLFIDGLRVNWLLEKEV